MSRKREYDYFNEDNEDNDDVDDVDNNLDIENAFKKKHTSYNDLKYLITEQPVDSLDDLIKIAETYTSYLVSNRKKRRRATILNIDLHSLLRILSSLRKLNSMIGMNELKKSIVYQIMYYLQGLHTKGVDMMHTVIMGDPGCGKTEVSKIIANIYSGLNILSTSNVKFVKRSDLIGEYLGQTAIKTNKVLESCIGGCLVIDEAYSLGHKEKRDSYSKECLDALNQFLTEHKDNFVCIIIGYEKALKESFFSFNEGLNRRFPWRYTINSYTSKEIIKIFEKQVQDSSWKLENNNKEYCTISPNYIDKYLQNFKNSGGDTDVFFTKCKMFHTKRIFGKVNSIRRC
jgi:SpoVK/Ycf46/Vps4 family AAA+-type ATPase